LEQEFGYRPAVPGWQSPTFHAVAKLVQKTSGNAYDLAGLFMCVQLDALTAGKPALDEGQRSFGWMHTERIQARAHLMAHGDAVVAQLGPIKARLWALDDAAGQ